MVTVSILATLLGLQTDSQLAKEARFLAALPKQAVYDDLKRTIPEGTKFTSIGFEVSSYQSGNLIKLTGTITGEALIASPRNAEQLKAWLSDKSQLSFPQFSLTPTDQILKVTIDTGRDFIESSQEYQKVLSVLIKELGRTNAPKWDAWDGFEGIKWTDKNITYSEDDTGGGGVYLERSLSTNNLPSVPEPKPATASKADYDALAAVLAGKKQSRVCISTNVLYQLKGYKLKPFGQRSFNGMARAPEFIAFASRPGGVPIALAVGMIAGRRVVEIAPLVS